MNIIVKQNNLPDPVIAPSGEYAWNASAVAEIMSQAIENNWIVLGGDVITQERKYTYNSWFYTVNSAISKKDNVELSVRKCLDYVNEYTKRNGFDFYYVLVLTNTFVDGCE